MKGNSQSIFENNGEMLYVKAKNIKVQWHGFYFNKRRILTLFNADNWEMLLKASVNLPDEPLEQGHIFIKNWSENENVLDFLINNHIVQDTGKRIKSDFVEIPVVKVLI